MKTLEDWKEGNLEDYLVVGNEVDEAMVEYFRDVLPPRTDHSHLMQVGEPYSHIDGRATYSTFYQEDGRWFYAGNCHAGERHQPMDQ